MNPEHPDDAGRAVPAEPTDQPEGASVAEPVTTPDASQSASVTTSAPSPAPPIAAPAPRRSLPAAAVVAIALVVALVAGTIAGGLSSFATSLLLRSPSSSSSTVRVLPPETDEPVVAAAAAALPSVVSIDVAGSGRSSDSLGILPEGHPDAPVRGNGSGIAYRNTEEGATYIVTNAHVVETADEIYVTGVDRERRKAELVGSDSETDIAVVRVDGELPVIALSDSDELKVGQSATAIGSPFGLSHSVTSGVISAIGRSLPGTTGSRGNVYPLVDVIQTDAAINPGNSGGALVDREGKLIGMNTAIYSDTGQSGGVGFAVPVNTVVRVAEQLIEVGSAQTPFLGIVGQDVTADLAQEEGLDVDEGAFVVEVLEGTRADDAGLRAGDVIVSLDDAPIRSMDDLLLQVRRKNIGSTVTLEVWRDGSTTKIEMEVGIKPADLETPEAEQGVAPDSRPDTQAPQGDSE